MENTLNPDLTEHPLTGGNVAASVVRVGATVRKPITEATPDVEAFLLHLEQQGFRNAPKTLGRDLQGRQILEYIPGETITEPEGLTLTDLQQIGAIIRKLHAASASLAMRPENRWEVLCPPPAEELICHNDLGPWNLVHSDAGWVFIDWDGSGPSNRLWDLAYAAQGIVPIAAGGDPDRDALRLRTFLDAYGLNDGERSRFPQILLDRTRFGYTFLKSAADEGREPWARIYAEGHGDYWRQAAEYVEEHRQVWSTALSAT